MKATLLMVRPRDRERKAGIVFKHFWRREFSHQGCMSDTSIARQNCRMKVCIASRSDEVISPTWPSGYYLRCIIFAKTSPPVVRQSWFPVRCLLPALSVVDKLSATRQPPNLAKWPQFGLPPYRATTPTRSITKSSTTEHIPLIKTWLKVQFNPLNCVAARESRSDLSQAPTRLTLFTRTFNGKA